MTRITQRYAQLVASGELRPDRGRLPPPHDLTGCSRNWKTRRPRPA
jgi:hypothetical protein